MTNELSDWTGDASILDSDLAFDEMRDYPEFEAVMQSFRERAK